jgi:acid phosphatase (class A)
MISLSKQGSREKQTKVGGILRCRTERTYVQMNSHPTESLHLFVLDHLRFSVRTWLYVLVRPNQASILHKRNKTIRSEGEMASRRISVAAIVTAWVFLVLSGFQWASAQEAGKQPPPPRIMGYLSPQELPDSLGLTPPPPVPGSAAAVLDEQVSKKTLTLKGTPAWELASGDADLAFPHVTKAFTCALGTTISEKETPRLYRLMQRSFVDAAGATFAAKDKYARPRPFMVNKESTCSPAEETRMLKSGSYPSGHTSLGWAWALILAEVAPDRANELLARGRAYGQGRTVCNVHWQSDIFEGMTVGAAAVARLHGNAEFKADVEAAKKEVTDARAKGLQPTGNCKLEAEAQTVKVTQLP